MKYLALLVLALAALAIPTAGNADVCPAGVSTQACDPVPVDPPPPPPPPPPSTTPPPPPNYNDCCYPEGFYYEGNDSQYVNYTLAGSGCKTVEARKSAKSTVFRTTFVTLRMQVYFCWQYPKITAFGAACRWTDVFSGTVQTNDCTTSGYYTEWRGDPKGGRYQLASGKWSNCVFRYGCWKSEVFNLQMIVTGNGTWVVKT